MTAFVLVRSPRALLVIVWLAAGIGPHLAIAQDARRPVKVEFEASPPRPDPLMLVGYLRRPERPGPSPAVVLLMGATVAGEELIGDGVRGSNPGDM
jgi:hypothetical protein